ncbi:hypothetical protein [Streptomyces sp. NPDC004134]|uniref:hypothetical protein n=1 Tax=Streptomyces sp. NPDC004134 TaxID=3364691 RepID=UPI0036AC9CA6
MPAPSPADLRVLSTPRPLPSVPYALQAVAAYAAVRLTGLLALCAGAALRGEDPWHRLDGRWDAVWYQRIARDGYGHEIRLPGGSVHPDLAFFPLLPLLERGLSAVSPLDAADAGLLVAGTASFAAAAGIYAVGAHVAGHRTGAFLAALWGAVPVGYVQWMAYTESLYTALAAWSLYAVLTGRWRAAGGLAAAAGLCRPSGVALIAALAVAPLAVRGGERRRAAAGVLLAPVGWLAYVTYVGVRRGSPTGYLDVQAEWGNRVDFGAALARFTWARLTGPWPSPLTGVALCAAFAALALLIRHTVRDRQPPPLLAYSLTTVALSLAGSAYFGSRPRLLLPAFPLLLPVAGWLGRWRWGAGTVAGCALASGVYGAVALLGTGPP